MISVIAFLIALPWSVSLLSAAASVFDHDNRLRAALAVIAHITAVLLAGVLLGRSVVSAALWAFVLVATLHSARFVLLRMWVRRFGR